MFSVQVKLFSNSFDPQLVDSVAMELTDVEGWLRILLYVLRQKKKAIYSWRNLKAFRLSLCAEIIASFYFLPVFLCFPFLYETK